MDCLSRFSFNYCRSILRIMCGKLPAVWFKMGKSFNQNPAQNSIMRNRLNSKLNLMTYPCNPVLSVLSVLKTTPLGHIGLIRLHIFLRESGFMDKLLRKPKAELFDMICDGTIVVRYRKGSRVPYMRVRGHHAKPKGSRSASTQKRQG